MPRSSPVPKNRGTRCPSHIRLVPCRGLLSTEWVHKARSRDAPATGGKAALRGRDILAPVPRSVQARSHSPKPMARRPFEATVPVSRDAKNSYQSVLRLSSRRTVPRLRSE